MGGKRRATASARNLMAPSWRPSEVMRSSRCTTSSRMRAPTNSSRPSRESDGQLLRGPRLESRSGSCRRRSTRRSLRHRVARSTKSTRLSALCPKVSSRTEVLSACSGSREISANATAVVKGRPSGICSSRLSSSIMIPLLSTCAARAPIVISGRFERLRPSVRPLAGVRRLGQRDPDRFRPRYRENVRHIAPSALRTPRQRSNDLRPRTHNARSDAVMRAGSGM